MYKAFLIKYGEIAIKGKNRFQFEDRLKQRILEALIPVEGDFRARKENGRIFVEMEGPYDFQGAVEALSRVFGIVRFCPVVLLPDQGFDLVIVPTL